MEKLIMAFFFCCLATGDVFDFINNSHRTNLKENATAA
jgi:hypothetical protein